MEAADDHPRAAHRRADHLGGRLLPGRLRPDLGRARTAACRSRIAVSGEKSIAAVRAAGRPPGRGRARRRAGQGLGRASNGRHELAQDRPDPDLLGSGPGRRDRARPTTSSAGSPAAGPSTPTCRRRPGSRARASSSAPRTWPRRSPAARTWTSIVEAVKPYWEAGFTDIAVVQVGDEGQQRFLDEAAGPLLEKLRAAAQA